MKKRLLSCLLLGILMSHSVGVVNAEGVENDEKIEKDIEKYVQQYQNAVEQDKKAKEEEQKRKAEEQKLQYLGGARLPSHVKVDLRYTKNIAPDQTALVRLSSVNIRKQPNVTAGIIYTGNRNDKLEILETVKGQYIIESKSDVWYKVKTSRGTGYVFSKSVEKRILNYQEGIKRADIAYNNIINARKVGYIYNYRNVNGLPSNLDGKSYDNYGVPADQSAPIYTSLQNLNNFKYLPDGMMVDVLEEGATYFKIKSFSDNKQYYVHRKYISYRNQIRSLTKVVVIDRKNQTAFSMERTSNKPTWAVRSKVYVTTGIKNPPHYFATPLGIFMAAEKLNKFYYTGDGTDEIKGYAPYAVRFSAGGYTHGVAVGNDVPFGSVESSSTLGTIALSHKCVRNYTSHAKFLYDWVTIGQTAYIVIE